MINEMENAVEPPEISSLQLTSVDNNKGPYTTFINPLASPVTPLKGSLRAKFPSK
jgi:hypothetical protein